MKIVADTNIIISAIISDKGKIGEILLNKPKSLEFLSPDFLLQELDNHKEKVKSLTGFSEQEYLYVKFLLNRDIEFIGQNAIKPIHWEKSLEMLKNIDEKETEFLALCMEHNCFLWTGDKKLINGLQN